MSRLGYRVKHGPRNVDEIEANDFSNDLGVAWRYRFLHHAYPRAKFILTVRDIESWLRSSEVHARAAGLRVPLRRLENRYMCFGRIDFDRDVFRNRYEDHNSAVIDYFSSFPGRLLVLDICAGDGWEKLCPFLRAAVPTIPFPVENRTPRESLSSGVV